jgi:ubiquinone/menaquinone biosynthesis C-methylase UbiE
MRNNYDPIARWYDPLSRLVFGQAQVRAQTVLLSFISRGSRILIVGGGTGWILEEIGKCCPPEQDITYVESSSEMIRLSLRRHTAPNRVSWACAAVEDFSLTEKYDVIFTPFLFNNFKTEKAVAVFSKLDNCLREGGRWLFVDFDDTGSKGRWWKKGLLSVIYMFFHVVCRVEASRMPDMPTLFRRGGYREWFASGEWKEYMRSVVYQKPFVDFNPSQDPAYSKTWQSTRLRQHP